MQDIHVTLYDSQLEQAVLRLAKQQQQNLQEFVITALSYYIQETEKPAGLKIQKLDPFQHAQAPTENLQTFVEDKSNLVFTDIDDHASFAEKLRQQAWQRHD